MMFSPPYPGPDRALGLTVRRLTVALADLRQAAAGGDLDELLSSTNALEEAAMQLARLAPRLGPEDIDEAEMNPGLTPDQCQFLTDFVELRQEHERTRALLTQALEITRGRYGRLCRQRPEAGYLAASARPAVVGRTMTG